MSVEPQCPQCHSTERPMSVRQEHDMTAVLVLFCASCGSIVGAADVAPQYPDLSGSRRSSRMPSGATELPATSTA